MKNLVFAAIGLALIGTPVTAKQHLQGDTIVVQPERLNLISTLEREISRELYRIPFPADTRDNRASGVVKVYFVANGDGRAEQVSLFEGSGRRQMDRAAIYAVSRLDNLAAQGGDQPVLLSIVFAPNQRVADRLGTRAAEENMELIASGRLASRTLAVMVAPSAPS
ncbi:hypothetical protein GCM10023208_26780 [Erythrobacter westpacificensis]|uniref:TonB C-terminal domain-containing protein n=1 Tax=Erythrobacter westpacificensis TaxID=1055231 RepID=A0ABP9KLJ4_9SPHN